MAANPSRKRHKTDETGSPFKEAEEASSTTTTSLPIPTLVDAILQLDSQAFLDHVLTMNVDKFKLIFARVSDLQKGMDNSLAKFLDIPPNVIAANVFPFIQNRTDWNNFALVNTDIHKAVTENKELVPPWPEVDLDISLKLPAFTPDGKFIAHGDEEGEIFLWCRTKGVVASWQRCDDDEYDEDQDQDDDDNEGVTVVAFSPNGNLLVTIWNYVHITI
jgi:WD40 repeat protein